MGTHYKSTDIAQQIRMACNFVGQPNAGQERVKGAQDTFPPDPDNLCELTSLTLTRLVFKIIHILDCKQNSRVDRHRLLRHKGPFKVSPPALATPEVVQKLEQLQVDIAREWEERLEVIMHGHYTSQISILQKELEKRAMQGLRADFDSAAKTAESWFAQKSFKATNQTKDTTKLMTEINSMWRGQRNAPVTMDIRKVTLVAPPLPSLTKQTVSQTKRVFTFTARPLAKVSEVAEKPPISRPPALPTIPTPPLPAPPIIQDPVLEERPHKKVDGSRVIYVKGLADPLSNFHFSNLQKDGYRYSSGEALYQVEKAVFLQEFSAIDPIWKAKDGRSAKQVGTKLLKSPMFRSRIRKDPHLSLLQQEWDKGMNFTTVRMILELRWEQDEKFRKVLEGTGGAYLCHNVWDPVWGSGSDEKDPIGRDGKNIFGFELMALRQRKLNISIAHRPLRQPQPSVQVVPKPQPQITNKGEGTETLAQDLNQAIVPTEQTPRGEETPTQDQPEFLSPLPFKWVDPRFSSTPLPASEEDRGPPNTPYTKSTWNLPKARRAPRHRSRAPTKHSRRTDDDLDFLPETHMLSVMKELQMIPKRKRVEPSTPATPAGKRTKWAEDIYRPDSPESEMTVKMVVQNSPDQLSSTPIPPPRFQNSPYIPSNILTPRSIPMSVPSQVDMDVTVVLSGETTTDKKGPILSSPPLFGDPESQIEPNDWNMVDDEQDLHLALDLCSIEDSEEEEENWTENTGFPPDRVMPSIPPWDISKLKAFPRFSAEAKIRGWTPPTVSHQTIVFGDSVLARIEGVGWEHSNDTQVYSYPGMRLEHAVGVLQKSQVFHSVKNFILAVGVNDRSHSVHKKHWKTINAILPVIREKFPNARLFYPKFCQHLTLSEMDNLRGLETKFRSRGACLLPYPTGLKFANNDRIHLVDASATHLLDHWLNSIHAPIKNQSN